MKKNKPSGRPYLVKVTQTLNDKPFIWHAKAVLNIDSKKVTGYLKIKTDSIQEAIKNEAFKRHKGHILKIKGKWKNDKICVKYHNADKNIPQFGYVILQQDQDGILTGNFIANSIETGNVISGATVFVPE